MSIEPLCLPIPDAAAAIGIKRARLYELIAEGQIEARKLGGKTLILRSEVERFVRNLPVAAIGRRARVV